MVTFEVSKFEISLLKSKQLQNIRSMFLADVVFHNDRFPLNVFLLWNRYPKCVTCDTFQYLSSPYFEITMFLLAALLERTSSMTPPREPTRSDASDSAPFPFGNKSKELIGTIVLLDTSKINGMQDNSSDGCCHMLAVLGESGGPRKTIGWIGRPTEDNCDRYCDR